MKDVSMQLIYEYYGKIQKHRDRLKLKRHGQVYTPVEIAKFMVRSVLQKASQEQPELNSVVLTDPFCGAGIFPLWAIRYLHEMTGRPKAQIVQENVAAGDIDLGAVNMTKRVLREECGDPDMALPTIVWGDTLDFYIVPSMHLEHVSDFDEIEKYNERIAKHEFAPLPQNLTPHIFQRPPEMIA